MLKVNKQTADKLVQTSLDWIELEEDILLKKRVRQKANLQLAALVKVMNATMLYVSNEGRSRRSDLIVEILDTIGISYNVYLS